MNSLKQLKAFFLAWAIETSLGCTVFVLIFGNVFYPIYKGINTSGWDTYSLLLFGFLGMVALAAFLIRVIESAKQNYRPLI